MEARLTDPRQCHPYHKLFEKEGQRAIDGSTPETAHLAKRCNSRAVDQEALGPHLDDIEVVAAYKMPLASVAEPRAE